MKNFNKLFIAAILLFAAISGVKAQTVITVRDSISTDTHWNCQQQYLLMGYVYVTSGATLTIDSGVIIKGDKDTKGALIIERGAKIYANGTKNAPVVFTSNQDPGNRSYGDWGGIILCGYAPVNWNAGVPQVEGGPRSIYGGTDPHDNSGAMHYVRIEYPGIAFSPNNEVNGLTFCGVGDATQIDHIQVSYSGDDSYEWFGGTVNTKYIVSYAGWDDDFDTDNGYSGFNQYGMSLRDPYAADQSGSKAWESDSYQSGTATGKDSTASGFVPDTAHLTKCVFSNYTVVGPMVSPTSTAYDPQFVSAAHVRRGSAISIMNSILTGYPCGILIDESATAFGSTTLNQRVGISQFQNNIVAGIPVINAPGAKEVMYVIDGARSRTSTTTEADTITGSPFAPFSGPFAWFEDASNKNKIYTTEQTGLRLTNPFNLTAPNFVPTSTSPVCYNNTNLPSYIVGDPFGNGRKYPYNGNLAINTDTSAGFTHYNAPDAKPGFSSSRLTNPFFTVENHVGAFGYTASTADNWTRGWCNFDPNDTDYTGSCSTSAIAHYDNDKLYMRLSPNPAKEATTLGYVITAESTVEISIMDVTGKVVATPFTGKLIPGQYVQRIETTNMESGVYFVNIKTPTATQSIKMLVTK